MRLYLLLCFLLSLSYSNGRYLRRPLAKRPAFAPERRLAVDVVLSVIRRILKRPPVFHPDRRLAVIDVGEWEKAEFGNQDGVEMRTSSEEEIENIIKSEIDIPSSDEAMKEVAVLGTGQTKEEANAEKVALKIALQHAVKVFKQAAKVAARAAKEEDIKAAKTAAKEVAKESTKQAAKEMFG